MTFQPNPFRWPSDMKQLLGLLSILATIAGAANYVGGKIYEFGRGQERVENAQKATQRDVVETKASILDENHQRENAFNGLKAEVVPRISQLESAVHVAQTEASAARQRADDMKESLVELKNLAMRNLEISTSHGDDISATRNAVAPRNPRGMQ